MLDRLIRVPLELEVIDAVTDGDCVSVAERDDVPSLVGLSETELADDGLLVGLFVPLGDCVCEGDWERVPVALNVRVPEGVTDRVGAGDADSVWLSDGVVVCDGDRVRDGVAELVLDSEVD